MAVTPDTELYLIKCPIEIDNNNQITFSSKTAQADYFSNLPHKLVQNITYQRKDNIIRFPDHIDNLIEYNYVMYKNKHYSNKYFYAYITSMEYINDNMTAIEIKTDVYQTWMFDLTFNRSFVEREHVNDDTIGLHTIPENLEHGDYITNSAPIKLFNYDSGMYICMCVSDFPTELISVLVSDNEYKIINNIYSGLYYLIFTDGDLVTKAIKIFDSYAKGDAIISLFMIPKSFVVDYINKYSAVNIESKDSTISSAFYIPKKITDPFNIASNITINLDNNINGYIPKNKKLFTGEYNYIMLSNNAGSDVKFNYEDFINNQPKFNIIGAITPGCSIKCVPLNYKLISDNNTYNSFDYSLNGAKLPICAWTTDVYTNWLTQNGINTTLSLIGSGVSTIVGASTGSAIGVTSGILGVASSLSEKYQHSLIPDQAKGNTNSGDITYTSGNSVFTAYKTCIKQEYAKIIDDYFQIYGYKVNSLKTPNRTGRRNWNYLKLINPNIEGNIPQEDLQEIKTIFSNGVTLWHNTNTFLDYSQNNDII